MSMKSSPLNFDILSCKLQGSHLIEASAGTGKTFMITRLFLRLILEDYAIWEILVVTFTVAATKELRERLRQTLKQAQVLLSKNDKVQQDQIDEEMLRLLNTYDKKTASRYVDRALTNFDEISVHTIHAFCKKSIEEQAFVTGFSTGSEIISDEIELRGQVVTDFWRQYIQNAPKGFLQFLIELDTGLEEWRNLFIDVHIDQNWSLPLGSKHGLDLAHAQEKLIAELEQYDYELLRFQKAWPEHKQEALAFFSFLAEEAKKDKVRLPKQLPETIVSELEKHVQKPGFALLSSDLENKLGKLESPAKVTDAPVQTKAFVQLWHSYHKKAYAKIVSSLGEYLFLLLDNLKQEHQKNLEKEKQRRNILFHHDLLSKLHSALYSPEPTVHQAILDKLRKKYRIALVDEFQDTDLVQAEIFHKIFSSPKHSFFLIGDPKQSIYAFRGSDLHVYQKLKDSVDHNYTLFINYRSCPPLLQAVHSLYKQHRTSSPFLDNQLNYVSTQAAPRLNTHLKEKTDKPPLRFIFLKEDDTSIGESEKRNEKRHAIGRQVGEKIAQLLEQSRTGELVYKDRPLKASNIAILVHSKNQAKLIRDLMQEMSIPAVLYVEENVFSSQEAYDLQLILESILEQGRGPSAKVALATHLWAHTAGQLHHLFTNVDEHQKILQRFRYYHHLWLENGFMPMFRQWLYAENLPSTLLGRVGGERALTNVLHLAELIDQHKEKQPQAILYYLQRQIQLGESSRNEVTRLRLETDADSVQIMTIHASKGLEFPFVFCPYLWHANKTPPNQILHYYSKEKKQHILVPAFLKKLLKNYPVTHPLFTSLNPQVNEGLNLEMMQQKAKKEKFNEELRLVYVALSRASQKLYIYWAHENKSPPSPAFYLFSGGGYDWNISASKEDRQKLPNLQKHLGELARQYPQSLGIEHEQPSSLSLRPQNNGTRQGRKKAVHEKQKLHTKPLKRQESDKYSHIHQIYPGRYIHSFSSLSRSENAKQKIEDLILDEDAKTDLSSFTKSQNFSSIYNFPRGTKSGLFFHQILEHINFADIGASKTAKQDLEITIERTLEQYHYNLSWKECIYKQLLDLIHTPLFQYKEKQDKDLNLRLVEVENEKRLIELEFYFDLAAPINEKVKQNQLIEMQDPLLASIAEYWQEKLPRPRQLFLRGYIDLVFAYKKRFYIIDWKSNFLGTSLEDYQPEKLKANVINHGYHLQYYIYVDALDRFLGLRQNSYNYEKHFGGVFYIYLRGINPRGSSGIYFDRPSLSQLEYFRKIHT